MHRENCLILIDGSNFYFKLRELNVHRLLNLDFLAFIRFLANDLHINNCYYYVGAIKTDGSTHTQTIFDAQRKLLAHLRSSGIIYKLGFLLENNGIFHEKGVDVNIAVDMVVATYENLCDRIILVSSDTDLLPAIKVAQEKGTTVEYVVFEHAPSVAMLNNCNHAQLLTKTQVQSFIKSD